MRDWPDLLELSMSNNIDTGVRRSKKPFRSDQRHQHRIKHFTTQHELVWTFWPSSYTTTHKGEPGRIYRHHETNRRGQVHKVYVEQVILHSLFSSKCFRTFLKLLSSKQYNTSTFITYQHDSGDVYNMHIAIENFVQQQHNSWDVVLV